MKLIISDNGYHHYTGTCELCDADSEGEGEGFELTPCVCGVHGVCPGCLDDHGRDCWCGEVENDGQELHLYSDL